jgi:predicted phage baseplate assembly protein
MSIEVPRLDTIDFESLVAEARERIPRYAPAWTDHNLHDPGITLVELLAWVTDQQVYQVGLVGERHRRAFARLLGVDVRPARPARGLLWPLAPILFEAEVPLATRVSATAGLDVPYLVDFACRLSPAQLVGLVGNGSRGLLDLLESDRRERASFPAGREGDEPLEWLELRLDRPILARGDAAATAGVVTLGIEVENPALPPDAELGDAPLWGPLVVEHRPPGGASRPVRILRDDTHALLRSGVLALEIPRAAADGPSSLRLRLELGFFPSVPRLARLRLNALPVVQLERVPEGLLAPGTGLPDQSRPLALKGRPSPGELAPPLAIDVLGSKGWERWEPAAALRGLGPEDRRFVLDEAAGAVRFGNGVNGGVPPLGARIRHSTYSRTLGKDGNVRAGLLWRVAGQGQQLWRNPAPLEGGEDAWDAGRTDLEAQRLARHPGVDLRDEAVRRTVLELPGFVLARVEILPRYHPALPNARLDGHRTVVVVPELMRERDLLDEEGRRYLQELRPRLEERRVAGERLHVMIARTVPVDVQARLLVEPGASVAAVEAAAKAALAARLGPLSPAGGPAEPPWPMGRDVDAGRLSGLLGALSEVAAVSALELATEGRAFTAELLPLGPAELPRGRNIEVRAATAEETADAAG